MGFGLWQKLLRYLKLWTIMGLGVCLVCMVTNLDTIKLYFSNGFNAIFPTILIGAIIIGGIATMLRR